MCTRRFEHQAVVQHHRIEHVVVEDGGETGRGRHLRATVRGHLGVVRQDARVIKQLLEIDARLRDILKTEEEEFQGLAVIGSQQFPQGIHDAS